MKVFTNIKYLGQIREPETSILKGEAMGELPFLEKAWLAIRDGLIHDYGPMHSIEDQPFEAWEKIDCKGKSILPTWVDSHTHLVYANSREQEFVDRIKGLTYEEIAQRGGGILNSAKMMANATEDALYEEAMKRLSACIKMGTGAIEIKSGYGLTTETELKMLRVINRIKKNASIPVKSTFLGAHAFPFHLKDSPEIYVNEIIEKMIPKVAEEGLAEYIDAFCEKGYFTTDQTDQILSAGVKAGLKPKVHVNQFNIIGGIETCVKHNAVSVDHLEVLNEEDLDFLKGSKTIPVALPTCSLFLSIPYTPARRIIDAGLPLAIATDNNPGSTPNGNMNLAVSLGCIKMKMTPSESINAATLNGAAALELSSVLGSITRGKIANFYVTESIPNLEYLPYSFGENHIKEVYINGIKY